MSGTPSTTGGNERVDLAGGAQMPLLGLGVWLIPNGRETEQAVRWALEAGYRHVDTAQAYGNEEGVGAALKAAGVPREEVFVATKFMPGGKDPERDAERSLERLGLDYVDLYLVHWPQGGPTWAWPGMERTLERGLARSIGVSNFDVGELDALLGVASVPPAVNQIHVNPFHHPTALVEACRRHGIVVEAYSPLTHGRDLEHRTIVEIARRVGRTPAQVLLRWGLEHGYVVIPKSQNRGRIEENAAIFDFTLAPEDVAALDRLDRTRGTERAVQRRWW